MKLTEIIFLTIHHSGPAGSDINRPTLADKPVDELIENLRKNGISIAKEHSEQTLSYQFRKSQEDNLVVKTATVPLGTAFPVPTIPARFYLRDKEGLELTFRNYDNTIQQQEGVYDGIVAGDYGIKCEFSFEREQTDLSLPKKIKSAMEKTYLSGENIF